MALVVFSRCSFTYFGHTRPRLSPSMARCSGLKAHLDEKLCDLLKKCTKYRILALILSIFTILNMSFNLWEWLLSQPIFLVSLIFIQRSKGTNGKVCLQGMNFHHKSDILEPRFWEETEWCSGQSHKHWRSGNSGPLPVNSPSMTFNTYKFIHPQFINEQNVVRRIGRREDRS